MSKVNLANATKVSSMLRTNSVLVEIDGSIRRIELDDLMEAINEGSEQLLRQVAWGVPLKDSIQSSPVWGRVGNLDMWEEYKSRSGRYLVTNAGKAAKLSVVNSGVFADGTTLSESLGHIMVIAPRLYYLVKTDEVTSIPYLWMSQLPISGHYIEAPCIGAYKGSISGSALVSRSGVAPAGSRTINAFWNAAQVNGKNWGLTNYDHRKFMIMLQLSEYGNPNCQGTLGNGVTGTNVTAWDDWVKASAFPTGVTKSLGDAFGKVDINWTLTSGAAAAGSCHVSQLGIEDDYGWQWEFCQGIYCGNSGNAAQNGSEIFIYEGNRMPSSDELATHPKGDYRQLTRPKTNGYISRMIKGEYFDVIAEALGGGGTSYWCDYSYNNNTGQLVLWGAAANPGAYAGLGYAASTSAWSDSSSLIGSRLAYYGPLTFMSGAELVASV